MRARSGEAPGIPERPDREGEIQPPKASPGNAPGLMTGRTESGCRRSQNGIETASPRGHLTPGFQTSLQTTTSKTSSNELTLCRTLPDQDGRAYPRQHPPGAGAVDPRSRV